MTTQDSINQYSDGALLFYAFESCINANSTLIFVYSLTFSVYVFPSVMVATNDVFLTNGTLLPNCFLSTKLLQCTLKRFVGSW